MKIKLFAMDVDGTMTDGRFTIDAFGNEVKTFNVKDGMAINMLKSKNILTAILTNHRSDIVKNRSNQLGIDYYIDSASDKLAELQNIADKNHISLNEIAYIGDDLNDLQVIKSVGISACPKDASKDIKKYCKYISKKNGGYGCIRDFVEELIKWQIL